jgi:hypothetical protein
VNAAELYVQACREILACTRQAAQAADRGRWEAVLAYLAARQEAMDQAGRLPVGAHEWAVARAQALPLLQEAEQLNRRVVDRVRRVRDLLRPVLGAADSRFLDTYR